MAGNISYPEFSSACRSFLEKSNVIGAAWQERTSKVCFLFLNAWLGDSPILFIQGHLELHHKKLTKMNAMHGKFTILTKFSLPNL